jgi:hypothetical protein
MFIPVIHGGVVTLLGILMLLFTPYQFIVVYFFGVLFALVALGMVNGLLFLPIIISLIGPSSEVHVVDGSYYLPPPDEFLNSDNNIHAVESTRVSKCVPNKAKQIIHSDNYQ